MAWVNMGLYGRQRNGAPAKDASAPLHQTCPGLTKGKERLPFSAFALRGRWLKTPCRWIKAIASDACWIQFGSGASQATRLGPELVIRACPQLGDFQGA